MVGDRPRHDVRRLIDHIEPPLTPPLCINDVPVLTLGKLRRVNLTDRSPLSVAAGLLVPSLVAHGAEDGGGGGGGVARRGRGGKKVVSGGGVARLAR